MKPLSCLALVALACGLLFSGCASGVDRPDSITVSVANLKALNMSLSETQFSMTLRFTSESLNAYGFAGSTHRLFINGGYVGKAVTSKPIGLPPLTSTTQDVTLTVENGALMQQLMAASGNPIVHYRLESVLLTKTGDDEVKVKMNYEGTLDLRHLHVGS